MALADGSVRLMEVVEGGREGERRVLLRETARCFPLKVGGGDDEEKEEQEGEEAAASFPSTSSQHPLDDPRAMALYLDVNQSDPNRIAVSFSDGRVAVLEAISTMSATAGAAEAGSSKKKKKKTLETRSLWRAHDAECWCISFSPLDKETVYTGADDCEFLAWDLRLNRRRKRREAETCLARRRRRRRKALRRRLLHLSLSHQRRRRFLFDRHGQLRRQGARVGLEEPAGAALRLRERRGGRRKRRRKGRNSFFFSFLLCPSSRRRRLAPRMAPAWRAQAPLCGHAFRIRRAEAGERRRRRRRESEGRDSSEHYRGHGADPSPLNGGAATLGYGCDWAFNDNGRLVAATASFYDNAVHLWEPR